MARVPSRYGLSIPKDISPELSPDSLASNCFIGQKFSKSLQEFLVDYSLSIGTSPMIQTDSPYVQEWRDEEFLSITPVPVDNKEEADADKAKKEAATPPVSTTTITTVAPASSSNEISSPTTVTYFETVGGVKYEVTITTYETGKTVTSRRPASNSTGIL